MDAQILSSRAVLGMYFMALESDPGLVWVNDLANLFGSDQSSETYPFLGQNPAMREVVGGRQPKGFRANSLVITNKHYEGTLEIQTKDLRRDKTGQLKARVGEFAQRSLSHWASLVSTLLLNGPSTACYDGQYFFDTDHSEGDSGSQSNDIAIDISALPCLVHGVVTAPSMEEMQQCILAAIQAILGFKDDRGEPLNEGAKRFRVMVPVGLYTPALAACATMATAALQNNMNPNLLADFRVDVSINPRLTWTDSFSVHRTDSPIKGMIRQSETEAEVKLKDENSEFAFDNFAIQIGIDAWRGAGYGMWQRACYVTMT